MMGRLLVLLNLPWILLSILNYFFFHTEYKDLIGLLRWYYQFVILGILLFPGIATIMRKLPDRGYAISKVLCVALLFYLNWIGTIIGFWSFTPSSLTLCLLILIVLSHFIANKESDLFTLLKENSSYVWKSELIYLIVFSGLLVIQSRHPEIFWGEKPMDFTLLNFNLRNTTLPMEDPWFAGETMHYYYLGYYIYAGMAKMSGVSGELGYALALVTSGALFAVTLFGLLVFLTKRAVTSLWGALLILCAGNFKSFSSIIFDHKKVDFYSFWGAARVFKKGGFAEFPSWSFLFADLHPHVMSYAFSMLYLLLLIYCVEILWKKKFSREVLYGGFLLSLSYGALVGINGWDFLIYSIFSCLYFLISFKKERGLYSIVYHGSFHLLGIFLFLPMLTILKSGKAVEWGVHLNAMNTLSSHFFLYGHWWIMTLTIVFPILFLHRKGIRWRILFRSLAFRLALVIALIAFSSELFFFSDRINTVFKVFTNIYILSGIVTVISFRFFKFYLTKKSLIPFAVICVIVSSIVLMGSYYNYQGITSMRYFKGSPLGLSGGQYMRLYDRGDYKIISWINDNIEGIPMILERYSKSFDTRATRISMHTGLPTYLGWVGHVYLRGASLQAIGKRKREIDYVFNTLDPIATVDFLNKHRINLIMVGDFERSYYSKEGLEKFSKNSEIFKLLYRSGGSALYGVGEFQRYLLK